MQYAVDFPFSELSKYVAIACCPARPYVLFMWNNTSDNCGLVNSKVLAPFALY